MKKQTFLSVIVSIFFIAACTQPERLTHLAGSYTLFAIDGHDLPFTPPHEGGSPEVRSAEYVLDDDGIFAMSMDYGQPSGKTFSRDFTGSYTVKADGITFRWDGAGRTTATIEGSVLTMNNEGVLFAFRKQSP